MRIYFAHSKLDYNTREETEAKKQISNLFPSANLVCPNKDIGECSRGMVAYKKLVSLCDFIIVLEHNNTIGRGVFEEINQAIYLDICVSVLRCGVLTPVSQLEIIDETQWKDGYARILTKK